MPASVLPVEHLFTLTASVTGPTPIQGGPQGSLLLFRATDGTFDGPRLKGTILEHSGGDWVSVRGDGSFKLDVRLTLITDDGAAIYMSFCGIGVPGAGGAELRTAPLFETGSEKYAWLNRVQGVATGVPGSGTVTYEVYALSI